jgi:hypothetical protein
MKKSELKNIIKECVKEVIFEEGILSGIITEVAQGLSATATPSLRQPSPLPQNENTNQRNHSSATKQKVLNAIGNNGYDDLKNQFQNPALFEGTQPAPSGDGQGPFSGVNPSDPGIDLNNIPGMGQWAAVAAGKRR